LEVDEAANAISAEVDPEANIIFGAAFDPSLDGKIRVSVVATGMDGSSVAAQESRQFRSVTAAGRKAEGRAPAQAQVVEEQPVMAAAQSASAEEPVALDTPADQAWMFEATPVAPANGAPAQPSLLDDDLGRAKVEPLAAETHSFSHAEANEDEEDRLFPSIHPDERRQQKGGWLSLFGGGRPRYEAPAPAPSPARERPQAAPVPQARSAQSAQLAEEPRSDEGEDLNIPSFLRRLAN
jgi:cell division protein FtsZ